MKKIIGILLAATLIFGIGFAIARLTSGGATQGIEKEITFSVVILVAGDFEIAMTPVNEQGEPELRLTKGETGTFTITTTASGGFDVPIEFTVSGLPEGSYSFSVNPVAPGAGTILTIDSTNLQSNTVYVCNLTARDSY